MYSKDNLTKNNNKRRTGKLQKPGWSYDGLYTNLHSQELTNNGGPVVFALSLV